MPANKENGSLIVKTNTDKPGIDTTSIDWASIEADYQNADLTVSSICKNHGITSSALYKAAKAKGWALRSRLKTRKHKTRQLKAGHASEQINPTSPIDEALEYITMELMHRIRQSSSKVDADHDKDARTLSSLVRTYEKLKDIRTANPAPTNKNEAATKDQQTHHKPQQDADSRRKEIAASLEKLINGL